MTCRQLYLEARRRLSQAGIDSPGVDAALLSQRFLGLDRPGLALHGEEEPAPEQAAAFLQAVEERAARRPLQYILGEWEFLGLPLAVGEGVLCPREDTAVLVESLAQGLQGRSAPRGLDLCAGTGAVALGLLTFLPGAAVQCVELSDKAFPYLEENLRRLGRAVGFDPEKLVMTLQIHSDIVRVVTEKDHIGLCHRDYPKCDALVTNTPGVALLVFTADCTPLLFFDPVTGAVGAAHAGWRGTAQAIGAKVVHAMAENFGAKPENIRAAIGPNIGMCHFETDHDVPDAMRAAFGPEVDAYIEKRGEKYHLDLKQINAMVLRRCGVEHIDLSRDCTVCSCDRFWSHRATGGERGSQGAVIVCQEVTG